MPFIGRKQVIQSLKQEFVDATNDLGEDTLKRLRELTPVRTGTLRDGYEYLPATVQSPTGRIVNDVPYHDFVNDGTPNTPARQMIELALADVDHDLRRHLRRVRK